MSANKVVANIFWDSKGIFFNDYLEKGRTINDVYYAGLLQRLSDDVKKILPRLAKKRILFHHDNAPAHSSVVAVAKINELEFKLSPQPPPYSPDLACSDFHQFPNLKKWLGGKDLRVINVVNEYFERLDKSHYKNGIMD